MSVQQLAYFTKGIVLIAYFQVLMKSPQMSFKRNSQEWSTQQGTRQNRTPEHFLPWFLLLTGRMSFLWVLP